MATKANPADQNIAPRDESAFSQIFHNIDNSKYPRALTSIDALLARYPTNSELVAAKGLCTVLSDPGSDVQREAGEKLLKQGLMYNLKSPRSWHLQGLYYRRQKQYQEALKCYQQCAKLDPTLGRELLNDIAGLQVQTRSWESYIETRRDMLLQSIGSPSTGWLGYAVANHMAGRYEIAIESLHSLQKLHYDPKRALVNKASRADQQLQVNQLVVYRVSLALEHGDYETGLNDLIANEEFILDKNTYHSLYAAALLHLDRPQDALEHYKILLDTNCECVEYIEGYFHANGISSDMLNKYRYNIHPSSCDETEYNQIKVIFDTLLTTYPKSSSLMKLALACFIADDFSNILQQYVVPALRKGVPSLFTSLRVLYEAQSKQDYIQQYMLTIIEHLQQHSSFPSTPQQHESPTALLSSYCYLAQHYDYLGDSTKALEYLQQAEDLTPTFIDIYVFRAAVYKRMGDETRAYYWIDYARRLDTADRYLNNKTTRYAYQAECDQHGEQTLALFVKEDISVESYQHSQQASWYHTQQGLSYKKKRMNALALKKLLTVNDHFTTHHQSTSDYNLFVLRRSTYHAHSSLLKYLDIFRKHKFHVKAMIPAIELLLQQYQQHQLETQQCQGVEDKTTCTKAVEEYRKSIEGQLKTRPLNIIRENLLKTPQPEDQASVALTPRHPNIDPYGWKEVDSTRAFLPDAIKYVNQIIDAFQPCKSDSIPSTDPQISSVCPITSALFLAITAACLNSKALYALKLLNHAKLSVDTFIANISGTKQSRQQTIRQQVTYLTWFFLNGTSNKIKAETLPFYLQGQLFISKIQVSLLFKAMESCASTNEGAKAAWATTKQYALDNGMIYGDILAALQQYHETIVQKAPTTTQWAIQVSSLLLAIHASKTSSFPIASLSLDPAAITNITSPTPASRTALRSLVYALEVVTGIEGARHPTITGCQLTPERCRVLDISQDVVDSVKRFGHTHFPEDLVFLTPEQVDSIKNTYQVALPPVDGS